ncbi:hypothetical protein [Massilia endophytica]|uniref:hypothetical protein n=1 Tax=Massilia endophytica TaxID=2899220 RepID=UPI001E38100E|nr:hypothetical protein [Massilia endophytica]UGQ46050.1 hypothetical protein LSQ66_20060 [Massilia endophytica]
MNSHKEVPFPIAKSLATVPDALKLAGVLGMICGFAYLLAYTNDVGIPFPLELSVLPSTLLLVGATSLVGMLFLVGGVLAPALLIDDPLRVTKEYFLAHDCGPRMEWARLKRYLMCVWMPMALVLIALLLLIGVFGGGIWIYWAAGILIAAAFGWIVATASSVRAFKDTKSRFILTMIAQTALSGFSYCSFLVLSAAVYPSLNIQPAWKVGFGALLAFSLVHMFVSIPQTRGLGLRILMPPHFRHEALPASAMVYVVAIMVTLVSMMWYPLNAKVGKAVLRAFRAGGGMPAIVCLKERLPGRVTNELAFDDAGCSEPLLILLDAGDKVYVAKRAENRATDKADGANAHTNPIALRQDEVRAKIYLPPAGAKGSAASAMRTHRLAPMGSSESLKS